MSKKLMELDEHVGLVTGSVNQNAEERQTSPQGFMPAVAYAFTLNMIVGAGVLGLPFAFYQGGVALSAALLGILSLLAFTTMMFIVEAEARAESIVSSEERYSHHNNKNGDKSYAEDYGMVDEIDGRNLFVIKGRKFELNELCEIFLKIKVAPDSKWRIFANARGEILFFRRFMEVSLFFYSLGSMWLYAAVFGSSFSAVVPLTFLPSYRAIDSALVDISYCSRADPGFMSDYCHQGYLFFLAIFFGFMSVMCLMDLSAQRALQMSLTSFGIIIMSLMVVTASVAMSSSPQPGSSKHAPFVEDVPMVELSGFGKAFTTALFSQLCHQGVPSFVLLLREKHKAKAVFSAALSTTTVLFCTLGVVCSLYFGSNIQSVVTLNWRSYTGGKDSAPVWAQICSYLVVMFPVVTVTAAFPIYGIVLVQNLQKSIPPNLVERFGKALNVGMRLTACALPIAGAAAVKDVSKILEFNGIFGFFIAFLIPSLLQYRSRNMCIEKWGVAGERTPYHWLGSHPLFCKFVLAITTPAFFFVVYEVMNDYVHG